MTIPARGLVLLGLPFAWFIFAADLSPVHAESARPVARAAKPTAVKAKPRPRVVPRAAKPPAPSAAKSKLAPAAKTPTDSAKPTQVMDFDTDQVEGQRLEPGFELIEAGPRRARQPSLVTPLRPEDSVVRKE